MAWLEFFGGVGVGVGALFAYALWLRRSRTDEWIEAGVCAHCRKMFAYEGGLEHWRVCPKHPARIEVESLQAALKIARGFHPENSR